MLYRAFTNTGECPKERIRQCEVDKLCNLWCLRSWQDVLIKSVIEKGTSH